MEKEVKAKKEHICDACNEPIFKGRLYIRGKEKVAKFDEKLNKQVGIIYESWKRHISCPVEVWYVLEAKRERERNLARIPETEHFLNNYQDVDKNDLPF